MATTAKKAKAIPDGYHSVTPYLCIRGAKQALDFYRKAFGAEVLYKLEMPDGRIGHAEIQIGNSRVMLSDEMPEMPDALTRSPSKLGGLDATQIGGIYTKDGAKRAIAQKTVVIPGKDGLYVMQLNADGPQDQIGPLMDATSAIDAQTTITP